MTTCIDCGGDNASRVEIAAHCDPLPVVTGLGEWCPACAESVQRIRGAAMLHWLLHWHAQWGKDRLATCRRLESEVDDLARDLVADLALCEAASEGPWSHGLNLDPPDSGIETATGGCVAHIQDHGNVNTVTRTGEEFSHADARFVAASREGWPAAIRRALTAEADVELWHAATLDREEIIERQAAEVERLRAELARVRPDDCPLY